MKHSSLSMFSLAQIYTITAAARTDIDLARLKAASDPNSGDWLHSASIASVGLKLNNEIRLAIAQRLGARACSPTSVFVASWSTPGTTMASLARKACWSHH